MSEGRVAVLGAGPIGLDAALAALEAGLDVTVYERGGVGEAVSRWRHVRMFSPWSLNLSPRMRTRLPGLEATPDVCPTGGEFLDRALRPLSAHPDLSNRIRTGVRVEAVSRAGLLKNDEIGTGLRGQRPFRLLLQHHDGREEVAFHDLVLDCTGAPIPNSLGDGGIPAPGERALKDRIQRTIPDVASEPAEWRGRRVLLVGSGHSAQTAAVALGGLAESGTQVLWVIRGGLDSLSPIEADGLPERAALTARAHALAERGNGTGVRLIPGASVEGLRARGPEVEADVRGPDGAVTTVAADRVLGLTGTVGDAGLYRQLQVHECYATSGPMKLAAALLGESSADCLAQTSHGVEALRSPEPDFFILGAKSYGRNNTFLLTVGYAQIDEVFAAVPMHRAG